MTKRKKSQSSKEHIDITTPRTHPEYSVSNILPISNSSSRFCVCNITPSGPAICTARSPKLYTACCWKNAFSALFFSPLGSEPITSGKTSPAASRPTALFTSIYTLSGPALPDR